MDYIFLIFAAYILCKWTTWARKRSISGDLFAYTELRYYTRAVVFGLLPSVWFEKEHLYRYHRAKGQWSERRCYFGSHSIFSGAKYVPADTGAAESHLLGSCLQAGSTLCRWSHLFCFYRSVSSVPLLEGWGQGVPARSQHPVFCSEPRWSLCSASPCRCLCCERLPAYRLGEMDVKYRCFFETLCC